MKNKKTLLIGLFIALVSSSQAYFSVSIAIPYPSTTDSITIWTPRQHNPVFAEPGKQFTIEIAADETLGETGWTAQVENDLKRWPCQVISAKRAPIDLQSRRGWVLTMQLTKDVSPELMKLTVRHRSGLTLSSERSVHIVPDMEQDFYILHQSDQHLTGDSAKVARGTLGPRWEGGSKQAIQWTAPIVNLINPRLVFQTGDNMQLYANEKDWCGMEEAKIRVDRFLTAFSDFTVPTVHTTGNHDLGWNNYVEIGPWRKWYTQHVGQRAFSFRMGSMYVLSSEWTSNEYFPWAKQDYAASWQDTTVRYRMLISHFYNGLDAWTTVATKEQPCDLLLVGHIHRTRVVQSDPYKVLSVGSAQDYQRAAFFNFQRTATGWVCEEATQHADGVNVHRLLGDFGAPTITAQYAQSNDGKATKNQVDIANTLPHDFYDGRVRFLMKKGKYTVDGGDILAQYDTADGKQTAVLVKVNIRNQSTSTVKIKRI